MTKATTKQAARARLLKAQAAEASAIRDRERANLSDLATFLRESAQADEINIWLEERIAKLRTEAAARRLRHQQAAGTALAAVRERGETVEWIAGQVVLLPARVREYLKLAEGGVHGVNTTHNGALVKSVAE